MSSFVKLVRNKIRKLKPGVGLEYGVMVQRFANYSVNVVNGRRIHRARYTGGGDPGRGRAIAGPAKSPPSVHRFSSGQFPPAGEIYGLDAGRP
jgi:hypothetical protein